MGKEPAPHACRPNSMDLNDAADMRDEAEQAFNDARKTRGKRDLLYVAVMACVIVMLTGAVCGRKDIIIASAVIAVTFSCAGSLACYRMKNHSTPTTRTIPSSKTNSTPPTTRTSWDALTPGKHSDHDFYPRYRKRDTWKQ